MTLRYLSLASLALAAVALSACGSTGIKALENVAGCERHYEGVVQGGMLGGGFSGQVKIDCAPPAPPERPPSPPV